MRVDATLVSVLLLFAFPLIGLAGDSLVGQPAPMINGKNAKDFGLLKLSSLMKSIYREKTAEGEYKEVDGKYVWRVRRNVVVVNFFATYCLPCIKEIPIFNRIAERYRHADVKLVYVNVDPDTTVAKLRRLIIKHRIRVPMMVPNQYHAVKQYQATSLPRIVLIDRQGKIVDVMIGLQEDLERRLIAKIDRVLSL